MTPNLKWEDPPPVVPKGRSLGTKWNDIADELKNRPGQWALLPDCTNSGNTLKILQKRGEWFESTSRKPPDGSRQRRIYARWNPPAEHI